MNDHRRSEAERFCRAVVDGDAEFVSSLEDADQEWLVAAVAGSFIALVRARLDLDDDAAIARAAAAELYDADDRRIPPWIVEGVIRMALGELAAAEGVPPQAVLDTHVAYVGANVARMSDAERDGLVEQAVDVVVQSGVRLPRR